MGDLSLSGSLDFGRFRVTPQTVRRQPRDRFEPTYRLDQATWKHLQTIERADHDLRRLPMTPDDAEALWQEALAMNLVGAARATDNPLPEDAIAALIDTVAPVAPNGPLEQEVWNHARFLFLQRERTARVPKEVADVVRLHALLQEGVEADAGRLTTDATFYVNEQEEVVAVTSAPEHVEADLRALLAWFHEAHEHPLVRVAVFFHEFLSIHPFRTGTFRLGLALNTLLLKGLGYPGVLHAPVDLQLSVRMDQHRQAFSDAHRSDHTPWIRHMAALWARAFGTAADRAVFRRVLPSDLEPREIRVAEAVAWHNWYLGGYEVKLVDLAERAPDIPRRTLQRDLARLCEAGVLRRVGNGKGTAYALAEEPARRTQPALGR